MINTTYDKDSFVLTEQLNDVLVKIYSKYQQLELFEQKKEICDFSLINLYQSKFQEYYLLSLDVDLFSDVDKMQNKLIELTPIYRELYSL